MRQLGVLIYGLAVIVGSVALVSLTAAKLSWMLGNFTAIVCFIGGILFAAKKKSGPLCLAALYGFVAAILCGNFISHYSRSVEGQILKDVEPRSLAAFSGAAGFYFQNASVRADLKGVFLDNSPDTSGGWRNDYHHVAPIVASDWNAKEPVTAWAACEDSDCLKNWEDRTVCAGLKLFTTDDDFRKAIKNAESTHRLRSVAVPVILKWVRSPEDEIKAYLNEFFYALQFWCWAWAFSLAVWEGSRLFIARKMKRN